MRSEVSWSSPCARIPAYRLSRMLSIFSRPRLDPIARRSVSASSAVQSPSAVAIWMSCSWNTGMPSVRFSTGSSTGCA